MGCRILALSQEVSETQPVLLLLALLLLAPVVLCKFTETNAVCQYFVSFLADTS